MNVQWALLKLQCVENKCKIELGRTGSIPHKYSYCACVVCTTTHKHNRGEQLLIMSSLSITAIFF